MDQVNQVKLAQIGTATVLEIQGDVTSLSEAPLTGAYQEATGGGAVHIGLQFDPGAYINSGGIAVLIQILAGTRANGQGTALTGLSDHFQKIFKMAGITKFAAIYGSAEAAAAALSTQE